MGYCSCGLHGSRLCDNCSACSQCDNVRMRWSRCPHGWCSPEKFCSNCWKKLHDSISHETCRVSHVRFAQQEEARLEAIQQGLPVIQAGVSLPSGKVFAWTSQGNFEVDVNVYHASLETLNHVLDIHGAIPRQEELPSEVYGTQA